MKSWREQGSPEPWLFQDWRWTTRPYQWFWPFFCGWKQTSVLLKVTNSLGVARVCVQHSVKAGLWLLGVLLVGKAEPRAMPKVDRCSWNMNTPGIALFWNALLGSLSLCAPARIPLLQPSTPSLFSFFVIYRPRVVAFGPTEIVVHYTQRLWCSLQLSERRL